MSRSSAEEGDLYAIAINAGNRILALGRFAALMGRQACWAEFHGARRRPAQRSGRRHPPRPKPKRQLRHHRPGRPGKLQECARRGGTSREAVARQGGGARVVPPCLTPPQRSPSSPRAASKPKVLHPARHCLRGVAGRAGGCISRHAAAAALCHATARAGMPGGLAPVGRALLLSLRLLPAQRQALRMLLLDAGLRRRWRAGARCGLSVSSGRPRGRSAEWRHRAGGTFSDAQRRTVAGGGVH